MEVFMRKSFYLLPFTLMLSACIILSSCGPVKRLDLRDVSYLYLPERFTLYPEALIFCSSPSHVTVNAQLRLDDFLLARKNDEDERTYRMLIRAKIFFSDLRERGGDTLSYTFQESTNPLSNNDNVWNVSFELPFKKGQRGFVELVYTDLNRRVSESRFYYIDRSKEFNACDFLWKESDSTEVNFSPFTDKTHFTVQTSLGENGALSKSFYAPIDYLAPPPMSSPSEGLPPLNARKTEQIPIKDFIDIEMPEVGIYELKPASGRGTTMLKFDKGFPDVKTIKALLEPLQYLCSEEEYATIKTAQNQKNAIDAFWLKCASTEERAVEFIKLYYGRIRQSNVLFTSYVEGWKSDRGLIYTLFGPPDNVFRQLDEETWFYTESDSRYQVSFRFLRVGNPFTDNDFELERNGTYRTVWFQQIDNWRNGRIPLTTRTLR